MTNILTESTPQSEEEYEAILNEILAEINNLNEQMRRDQLDIDSMKAASEAYKAEAERHRQEHLQWKAEMERLKCEGDIQKAQIRETLERLEKMVERTRSGKS